MPLKDLKWTLSHGKIRLTVPPLLYHCEPTWSWSSEVLPDHALLVVFDGRGLLEVDGKTSELRQGICYFLKPGTKVEARQNPSYPLFIFLARFDILDTPTPTSSSKKYAKESSSVFIRKVRNLEALAEVVVARNPEDLLSRDAISMLIRLIVEEARNHSGDFDSRAYEALYAIENDLARKWTVASLAEEAGMPSGPFARSFRRMMNEPPIHYVIRRRMEEAKRQIQQSALPIEEIAINLGYTDLGFFRSIFRKHHGCAAESLRENRGF